MSTNMNIHPPNNRKWETVKASHGGAGCGSCVNLSFDDYDIHIHYGDETNSFEFITQLKKAVAGLPNIGPACGKE